MNIACEVEPTHTSDAAVGLTEGPFVPHASEPPGVTALHGADHAARQFARSRREAARESLAQSPYFRRIIWEILELPRFILECTTP